MLDCVDQGAHSSLATRSEPKVKKVENAKFKEEEEAVRLPVCPKAFRSDQLARHVPAGRLSVRARDAG